MTHRILVIGDTHFRANHERNAARIAAMEEIIAAAAAMVYLDGWIHLGDVYDTRSTPDDRNYVADVFTRLGEIAPGLIIAGNHESPGDLDIFSRLRTSHPVTVALRPAVVRLGVVAVAAIPYPHRGSLIAAGLSSEQVVAAAQQALDVICLDLQTRLEAAALEGCLPMVAGHATVTGARTSAGQPMGLDTDIAVTAAQLARFGAVPKVFGHIHLPQAVFDAVYVGSIAPSDWSETEEKRWVEVAWHGREGWELTSHAIDTPKLFHVEGTLTREGFDWQVVGTDDPIAGWTGAETPALQPVTLFAGADVRVRYRFNAAEQSLLDVDIVKKPFAGARRIELDPIAERTRAVRAPAVAAATTLSDKVEAYLVNAGLRVTPGFREKLVQLQQPGADVLTSIAQTLAGAAAIAARTDEIRAEAAPVNQEPVGTPR